MIEFLQHTPAEQRQAFLLTAQKKHLPEPSIEKDWWVTQILNIVFSLFSKRAKIAVSPQPDGLLMLHIFIRFFAYIQIFHYLCSRNLTFTSHSFLFMWKN